MENAKVWLNYKINEKSSIQKALEYQYSAKDAKKKKMIVEALLFWKFVFEKLGWNSSNQNKDEWERRYHFLSDFKNNINPLIKTIVMIESLPTTVWRKILWKHNIDFMSFESFLRRIDKKQQEAIADCYESLFLKHQTPSVFSRWGKFWNRISAEGILNEDFDYGKRYKSKGSMSYNLLGLDFGFNAYPRGIKNDEKIIEISPLRFLSIKNHADDFIVNTESDGKYWKMYKTARSNYAYKPDREVTLKTHICPGFWYTIFVHMMFWIISPLACSFVVVELLQKTFFTAPLITICFFGIVGILTPLWLFLAVLRFVINRMAMWLYNNSVLKKLFVSSADFTEKISSYSDNIIVGILMTFIIAVIGMATFLVYHFLVQGFGIVWTVMIIATAYIYIGGKFYYESEHGGKPRISDYPVYFRFPILAMTMALVVKFIVIYYKDIIQLVVLIGKTLVFLAPISLLMVMPLALLGLVWYSSGLDEQKQDKIFVFLEKIMVYFLVVVFGLMAIVSYFFWIEYHETMDYQIIAISSVNVFLIFFSFYVFYNKNPKVKETVKNVKYLKNHNLKIDNRILLQNKWFQTLNSFEREQILDKVFYFIKDINSHDTDNFKEKAIELLFPRMTEKMLDILCNHESELYQMGNELTLIVLRKILLGLAFDKACREAVIELISKNTRRARNRKILRTVFFPMIIVWNFFKKMLEYPKTLYRLYELFNERCPYVQKGKTLELN